MSRKDLSTLLEKIDTDDVEPLQRQGDTSPAFDPVVAPQAVAAPGAETPRVKSAPPRKRQPAQPKKAAEPAAAAAPAPVVPAPAGESPCICGSFARRRVFARSSTRRSRSTRAS
ncbi:hypothetical protein ACR5MH_0495 (plasmid) [Streptomyces sp. L7]